MKSLIKPLSLLFFVLVALDCEAKNYLEPLQQDIKDTFGANSMIPYLILLAEGVMGALAYSKTKNIMVLGGVPVLMVFTHFALA